MANSSILGGERAPSQAAGRDTDALGPSDSSDTGSDIQGERINATEPDDESTWGAVPVDTASDSDSTGTGERASAIPGTHADDADIRPDHVEPAATDALDTDAESIDDMPPDVAEQIAVDTGDDSDDDLDDLEEETEPTAGRT